MDWTDPAARAALAESVGATEYNRQHAAYLETQVVDTANGYPIRATHSRFGRLMQVVGTDMAFHTIAEAVLHANSLPAAGGTDGQA